MQQMAAVTGERVPVSNLIHLSDRLPAARTPAAVSEKSASGIRTFEKNQEIFGEGDPADYFYQVVSGAVRTYKLLSDGRRQIDAFHFAGDLFGLEVGQEHRFSAEAIKDVKLRAFRRCSLTTLARTDPALADQVFGAMAQSIQRAQDHMLLLGRKCARERIASFLLGLAQRVADGGTIELPMSRTDIADHLGLTIETVSRVLMQLQRERVIDLPSSRRTIVLRNTSTLQQLDSGDVDEQPMQIGSRPVLHLAGAARRAPHRLGLA